MHLSLEFSSSPLVKIALVLVSLREIAIYFEFHPTKCFVKSQANHQTLLDREFGQYGWYNPLGIHVTFVKVFSTYTIVSFVPNRKQFQFLISLIHLLN